MKQQVVNSNNALPIDLGLNTPCSIEVSGKKTKCCEKYKKKSIHCKKCPKI